MSEQCVENYEVLVVDRGGTQRVGGGSLVNLASVRWSRLRNNTSSATVSISATNCVAQIDMLQAIAPGRHELVIYRGNERVWEGPIDEVAWTSVGVTVTASDVFRYVEGTEITRDWIYDEGPYATTNMLERVESMLRVEMGEDITIFNGVDGDLTLRRWENFDPPANVLPFLDVRPGNVVTASRTLAFQMMLGEHFKDLARSNMNYTALGRSLIFWDSRQALHQTRTLTDNDFSGDLEVISTAKNLSLWSHAIQTQEQLDAAERPFIPRRSYWSTPSVPMDDYYGAWSRIVTADSQEEEMGDPDEIDYEALRTLAQTDARGRYPTPLEIRTENLSIFLSSDLPLSSLVPGTVVPVAATWNLRPIRQPLLLSGLSVEDSGSGETVQPTLIPAGPVEVL